MSSPRSSARSRRASRSRCASSARSSSAPWRASFVRAEPPRSPVLLGYGDGLPAFVERFEPASCVPYLADVIRLEIATSQAYHAADAEPVDAADLAAPRRGRARHRDDRPASGRASSRLASSRRDDRRDARTGRRARADRALARRGRSRHPPAPHSSRRASCRRAAMPFSRRCSLARTIAAAIAAGLETSPGFDPADALAGLVASGAAQSFRRAASLDGPGARP